MNARIFFEAINQLGDSYYEEAADFRRPPTRRGGKWYSPRRLRRLPILLTAAILAVFLLCAGAAAMIYGGHIQSWFSRSWEAMTGQAMSDQHTAILDHLSQEIGISQRDGDITITVDSAAVGDDLFYLLLRAEGIHFSDKYSYAFEDCSVTVSPALWEEAGGLGSCTIQSLGLDGDGTALFLVEYICTGIQSSQQEDQPIEITLRLKNLVQNTVGEEEKRLSQGEWTFQFSLDRSQFPDTVQLPDASVQALDLETQEEVEVVLFNIELTCTELRFQYDCQKGTLSLADNEPIYAVLESGAVIGCSGGGALSEDHTTLVCSFQWYVPVNPGEIAAVQIGGTQIAVP